jgi:hypothetical protein
VIEPLDPYPDLNHEGLELTFIHRVAPQVAGDMTRWTPFGEPTGLHHHSHTISNGTSLDQDLTMTGTVQFTLRGLRPVIG